MEPEIITREFANAYGLPGTCPKCHGQELRNSSDVLQCLDCGTIVAKVVDVPDHSMKAS